jgi:hypothetical protein
MRICLLWSAMINRMHRGRSRRAGRPRRSVAVLATIAGLAVLATGCGVGALVASAPSRAPQRPSSSPGAQGSGTPGTPATRGTHGAPGTPAAKASPRHRQGRQAAVNGVPERPATGGRSGVSGGALFGGTQPLTRETAKLGRKLAIVRVYYEIGQSFPTVDSRRLMASGSTLLVSLDTVPGHGPSYASIAAGHEDATIRSFLRAVNRAAVRYHLGAIYICFEHEANDPRHLRLGPPSEFIKAWDHVHRLAQEEHLNWNDGGRLHWVLILEHWAYFYALPRWQGRAGGAKAYWPGRSEVDVVAADGYNHVGCTTSKRSRSSGGAQAVTPQELFDPLLSFAHMVGGLPVFIAEWGSQAGYGAAEQPTFIGQMRAFVSANREVSAVMYFDWRNPKYPACSSIINNHPASVSAMAAMGHSADLQGRVAAAS